MLSIIITVCDKDYENCENLTKQIAEKVKKFEGTNNVENYLGYESLKIAHECVVTEMNRFINRDWK